MDLLHQCDTNKQSDCPIENLNVWLGYKDGHFEEIVKVLQDAASHRETRGCCKKLCLEDQALVCLTYWREYRTYFHIASDWQVSEATVCRTVHWVEIF